MTRATKQRGAVRGTRSDASVVRVACYCRISVSERGESHFTSIEAQREALHAYVASQRALGWRAVDEVYDDDGFTGGNTDRSGFQRLMADARAGKLDVVAVVRLDRLSRRQLDFLQTLADLEECGVRFVSTTQNLDTSTAMGRCILGVMGAFAQLERETISERTKAKMLATRRKGLWTGGRPVLGFDVRDKKLVVNEAEAVQVRRIFELYLEVGGTVALAQELRLRGVRNKRFVTAKGVETGGGAFDKNSLLLLLRNPAYVGRLRAGDEVVEGEHEAIIEEATWSAVQAQLDAQAPEVKARPSRRCTALLSGIARCRCGSAMTPTTAKAHGRTYSYYACAESVKRGRTACTGSRVAAGKLEKIVVDRVREVGRDPAVIDAALAADRAERGAERERLLGEAQELRAARGRHVGERERLLGAVGDDDAPEGLLDRVRELDDLVAEADARLAALERDVRALEANPDADGLRAALAQFDNVWAALEPEEQARLLALVIDEVVVDGPAGEVEIRLRGWR